MESTSHNVGVLDETIWYKEEVNQLPSEKWLGMHLLISV